MAKAAKVKGIKRIADANINRAKEGFRVCEDVLRFIACDRVLTARFKHARHSFESMVSGLRRDPRLLGERESRSDVGRTIPSESESKRGSWKDIFWANLQRVKESLRVLEEFSKLDDVDRAGKLKALRYKVYELEKQAGKRINDTA